MVLRGGRHWKVPPAILFAAGRLRYPERAAERLARRSALRVRLEIAPRSLAHRVGRQTSARRCRSIGRDPGAIANLRSGGLRKIHPLSWSLVRPPKMGCRKFSPRLLGRWSFREMTVAEQRWAAVCPSGKFTAAKDQARFPLVPFVLETGPGGPAHRPSIPAPRVDPRMELSVWYGAQRSRETLSGCSIFRAGRILLCRASQPPRLPIQPLPFLGRSSRASFPSTSCCGIVRGYGGDPVWIALDHTPGAEDTPSGSRPDRRFRHRYPPSVREAL